MHALMLIKKTLHIGSLGLLQMVSLKIHLMVYFSDGMELVPTGKERVEVVVDRGCD